MMKQEDKRWLEGVLKSCFGETGSVEEKRLLKGFSFLIRHMLENTERIFDETQALWETEPKSMELRRKFSALKKCLYCIRRYCEEKIEFKHNN